MAIPRLTATTAWVWTLCCFMLLATAVNYLDRLVLNQAASQIKRELSFDSFRFPVIDLNTPTDSLLADRNYGILEGLFGLSFALGAVTFGWIADRVRVAWLYPAAVVAWSIAGFCSGLANSYGELLVCRCALGFFESANWPCGLITTRLLLEASQRNLGNGLLQSGAALGAVLTPPLMLFITLGPTGLPGSLDAASELLARKDLLLAWRLSFQVVGIIGVVWACAWLTFIRGKWFMWDKPSMPEGQSDSTFAMVKEFVADRRFWILLTMVVTINLSWQFLRAWMPPFLGEARSYSPVAISLFSSLYYLVADFGSIACGALALGLSTRLGVQGARRLVFLMGALACLASIPAAILPAGRTLEMFLLLLGFGSLGVFPIYYSQCQEFPARWQGRVSGILGSLTWVTVFMLQIAMGTWVSSTKASFLASELAVGLEPAEAARAAAAHAYTLGFALAGLPPLLGFAALMCWPTQPKTETHGPTGTA